MAVLHSVLLKYVRSQVSKLGLLLIKRPATLEFDDPDTFLEIVVFRLFFLELRSPFYKTWCTLGPKETSKEIDMYCLVISCHCDLELEIVLIF